LLVFVAEALPARSFLARAKLAAIPASARQKRSDDNHFEREFSQQFESD
jgi:hypothetical protein